MEHSAGQVDDSAFGHTSTGHNTRPAPEPGLGLECEKLDKAALKAHFDHFIGRIMSDIGPPDGQDARCAAHRQLGDGPAELDGQIPAEFHRLRGYDLLRYLPVMTGRMVESLEVSERFLWDLRQTVLELIAENHAGYLAELANRHGMRLSIEPYDGAPCDDMTYGWRADVPMGEFWWYGFDTCFSCTEASSIAPRTGNASCGLRRSRPIGAKIGGPARPRSSRWATGPSATASTASSSTATPSSRGSTLAGHDHGPLGHPLRADANLVGAIRAWHQYLARCQYLLLRGLFVADVFTCTPKIPYTASRPGPNATRRSPPRGVLQLRRLHDRRVLTPPHGEERPSRPARRHELPRALLPDVETITLRLLGKIKELVDAGETVIGAAAAAVAQFGRLSELRRRR